MTTLVRTLGLRDLTLLVIGIVIGSGIFLVPGLILKDVGGSVALSMLVWVAGGVLSFLGALTFGELSAMDPSTGGIYVYLRGAFGPMIAFLYGWMLFLVSAGGAVATLAVAFSTYFGQIVPLGGVSAKIVSVAMIGVITRVNVRGTRGSSDLQNWTTGIKVAAIFIMSVVLLSLGHHRAETRAMLWPQDSSGVVSGFGIAMIAVLWAYEGWQFASFSSGEAREPQRDFPRAFFAGTLALIAIYITADFSYLIAIGPKAASNTITIAATAVSAVLKPAAGKLVAFAILIATFSSANSIQLTAPRVFYAMAEDKLFFRKLAEIHPRFRTPATAIIAGGIWAAILSCIGTFQQLLTYAIFAAWIFYGLAAASVFVYRMKRPELPRPYRVPGYPFTPAIFVLAAAALVVNTILSRPQGAAEGLGIVLLGLPAYFYWRRRRAATTN
ncbi:MAG TPA: amino acid permease [Candidatus Acidoferrales bacterium]|nr:amino acid permease [Candidatus Acidoferrales bacterium]